MRINGNVTGNASGNSFGKCITTVAQFQQALSNERRIEFAFESQHWFDLVRFKTMTTATAGQAWRIIYRGVFQSLSLYTAPTPTLA